MQHASFTSQDINPKTAKASHYAGSIPSHNIKALGDGPQKLYVKRLLMWRLAREHVAWEYLLLTKHMLFILLNSVTQP